MNKNDKSAGAHDSASPHAPQGRQRQRAHGTLAGNTHTSGPAKARPDTPAKAKPVTEAYLERAALHYLGRFGATKARLRQVLEEKIRRRQLGERATDQHKDWINALIIKCERYGYVDDQLYAEQRLNSLFKRGKTLHTIAQDLRHKGVEADVIENLLQRFKDAQPDAAFQAALHYARRRRFGPYYMRGSIDDRTQKKHRDAMMRAGFRYDDISRILSAKTPDDLDGA